MSSPAKAVKPQRIQRKRTKGWKMPPNTVYVGRPTKWGNPFEVGKHGDLKRCMELYRILAAGYICISISPERVKLQERAQRAMKKAKEQLHGKNLACFCRLDKPCHADVLLEIANEGPTA